MTYLDLSPLALAIALGVPPVVPAVADDDAEAEALYQVVRELHTALAVNDSAAYRRLYAPLYVRDPSVKQARLHSTPVTPVIARGGSSGEVFTNWQG